jgi:hypothetical protein
MSLHHDLQHCETEEDVKDAYIRALGLKTYRKGLIDIQTDEVWFEAKESPTPIASMFAQLLWYVKKARDEGETIPPFLSVVDREKAAILETTNILPAFADKKIKWLKNASSVGTDKALIAQISPYLEAHFTVFHIEHDEAEFIRTVKAAIAKGAIIRTPITPDNLRQVFDKWVEMIGRELSSVKEADYALLFFADIMFDPTLGKASEKDLTARLLMEGENPVFLLHGKTCELATVRGYRRFWSLYHRPPDKMHRNYLLSRRDSLLPIDERSFKGAFYTPLKVVDKAYDLLTETLGKNWQQQYIVWDPCCGVGNLEVKHNNHRNVFMSTLDKADVDVMQTNRHLFAESTRFQYDYLNDDINDAGEIDYTLTNKMPKELRQAIADAKAKKKGAKKILILMNPPYGEATNEFKTISVNKKGVVSTAFANTAMKKYGKATNELFTQFVARIAKEIPYATLAMFSTLKYVNASNFETFRKQWQAKHLGGFIINCKVFDGLKGNFPIGFLVWDTSKKVMITEITTKILDKDGSALGNKIFVDGPNSKYLNLWIDRPKANSEVVIPLKNAISPSLTNAMLTKWSDDAIGYLWAKSNDMQQAPQQTVVYASVCGDGHGIYINRENLWKIAVVFSVRQLISHTWINHNDQFLQPTGALTDEFKNDCLIYMLFAGKNCTASANDLEWSGKKWSIVNHFIPFTEAEVGANGKFESDFMVRYLKGKKLSPEAKAVFMVAKKIWRDYHATTFERKIREELKLNRADVGWYQIRNALSSQGDGYKEGYDLTAFKTAYDHLSQKLIPQVYSLGFLK